MEKGNWMLLWWIMRYRHFPKVPLTNGQLEVKNIYPEIEIWPQRIESCVTFVAEYSSRLEDRKFRYYK